ncbi:transcription antitermination factor NusB [Roseospirillum parvum]|uniref:Transcription antitermination protein NusB n=1 Tax=Roseospirillum parvum TaxID=83401 RepID=A0A1G7Y5R3_9PROT|nr:transcription antitermination factor NusB [Roseospirillum parvum]SDG91781.1 N utilization substance protein B [Roseospirillum parvum]
MTADTPPTPLAETPADPRSMARLNAVQALYGLAVSEAAVDDVLLQFLPQRLGDERLGGASIEEDPDTGDETDVSLGEPDSALLIRLVRGVCERRDDLDRLIGGALTGDWTLARLELTVLCLLQAGVWELLAHAEVPSKVVITEYVELARAFYAGPEPAMVNAVLDRLARTVREGGLAAAPPPSAG